jgi:DegV family protein with EDD domain
VIGLVTDSNSQLPSELARRYAVEVVPLTVTVDGVDHAEGEDLDADAFWARFEGRTPSVTTSQPSPGRFAATYAAVAARGAEEILSIHVGTGLSGTVNSARLAADSAPVPVRVVDTGTASFAVACCVWEAAEALARGASAEEAAAVAGAVASRVGNVFVVGALDLARAGGRLAEEDSGRAPDGDAIPVLSLQGGAMKIVGRAGDLDEAAAVMADAVRRWGSGLRVGIGVADAGTEPVARALEARLVTAPEVREMVRYRVGPSVGAHTGPGTVGAVFYAGIGGRGASASDFPHLAQ